MPPPHCRLDPPSPGAIPNYNGLCGVGHSGVAKPTLRRQQGGRPPSWCHPAPWAAGSASAGCWGWRRVEQGVGCQRRACQENVISLHKTCSPPAAAAAAQELLTQVKSILPHCCLCQGARPRGRSSVGVLRAGKEPREHIWVGAAPWGSASSPKPPQRGPPLGQLAGHGGSRLPGQPHLPGLKRLPGAGGTRLDAWMPTRGVPGLAAAADGRAPSTAGSSCGGKATERLICKINAAKSTLAEPSRGGNLSTGCVVLWAGTRAGRRAASTPKPQAPRSPKPPCVQRIVQCL